MIINANTKISAVLKYRPEALETIISINGKFNNLRNPLIRKLMAGRTTLAMASKIGGCTVADFLVRLQPMGFEIDDDTLPAITEKKKVPGFMSSLDELEIIDLDVRPIIASGKDPLTLINEAVKALQAGQVLRIINSFEPAPLIFLLKKQGFESFADMISENLVETYFYKNDAVTPGAQVPSTDVALTWDTVMERFKNAIQIIEVRSLEMPLPMLTILDALDNLKAGTALFVYHKKIPVYLLPELADRNFSYRVKEISDGEVHLIIFKD